jgi:hypothetical protein
LIVHFQDVDTRDKRGHDELRRSTGRRFAQNAVLLKRIKVIWVVQSPVKKFSVSRPTQISRISLAVPPL